MADQEREDPRQKMDIDYVEKRYPFEEKEQRIQKIFMTGLIVFLVLGVLGMFGSGYLSERTLSGSTFDIEYQQYLREDTTTDIYINLKDPADTTVVSIPANYMKEVKIEQVTPEPESVTIEDNKLLYSFITGKNGVVAFYMNPEWSGSKELEIGVQGEIVRLNQFIYF